jgi:hypothetical protein
MVASFGGPIFAARGQAIVSMKMGGGSSSGGVPTGVVVRHDAVQRGDLTVETTVREGRAEDWLLVQHLLGSDLDRDTLVFPVASVVDRETVVMKVLGRRRRVMVFRCGTSWIARTRSGGRTILVHGHRVDPASLEIVRLLDDEVNQAIADADEAMRRARQQ